MHLVSVHTAGSGQPEPSQSCAWSGGTSTFQADVPIKLKSPHLELWSGGTSTLHACLPVKLKSGGFTLAQLSCTCCPAVNCDCCWVMLSPCLAFFSSRVPQFWHWYYDAYMTQTAHQWMVRVLRPNIPVCMWKQSIGTFSKFCIHHSINVLTEAHYSSATALWSCPDSVPPSVALGLPTCWS